MSKEKSYKKLLKAKQEFLLISKDGKNPHFKSEYATINSMLDAVEPALISHGLLLIQPSENGYQYSKIIDVDSGEVVEQSSLKLPDSDNPQKIKSGVTYYRRTTLENLLSLQTVDDDGNDAVPSKPALEPERFINALKSIKNNDYTSEKLLKQYELTDNQKAQLNKIDF